MSICTANGMKKGIRVAQKVKYHLMPRRHHGDPQDSQQVSDFTLTCSSVQVTTV